jgi:hypothetical protein
VRLHMPRATPAIRMGRGALAAKFRGGVKLA